MNFATAMSTDLMRLLRGIYFIIVNTSVLYRPAHKPEEYLTRTERHDSCSWGGDIPHGPEVACRIMRHTTSNIVSPTLLIALLL
jgi:hypothetical protein